MLILLATNLHILIAVLLHFITGADNAEDIHDMKVMLEQIWEADNQILEKLAVID